MTPRRTAWMALAGVGLAAAVLGWAFMGEGLAEAWLVAFVVLAGLSAGGLGLLMIGHLLGDIWLAPVRSELEGAALTMPLVALLTLPLAAHLGQVYPWTLPGAMPEIPAPREAYLEPSFFLLRSAAYFAIWTGLAIWITRAGNHRRASAVGLALLAPTLTLAGIDWVMARDPRFWSSLFGFAFALSQLLAALAGAILVSILRFEHPAPKRLYSLERALLALTLLTLWTWFVQFLVVWLANLPDEAAWYAGRFEGWLLPVLVVALAALFAAIVILIPPGAGRFTIAAGSALLLVSHAAHMTWLVRPAAWIDGLAWGEAAVLAGIGAVWAAWFALAVRERPSDAAWEREAPDPGAASGAGHPTPQRS